MDYVFDYRKLAGRIVEKCGSQRDFSQRMGISEHTISKKMTNDAPWKQQEMMKAADVLELAVSEIPLYFFTTKTHS